MTIGNYEGLALSQRMTMALMTFMPCKRNVAALLMLLRGQFKTATRSSVEGLVKDLEKRGFLAVDHAHRIGQKNPVTVYRLIASDTVEERVIELHREKREMATDILGGTGSAALSPETLMKLFG